MNKKIIMKTSAIKFFLFLVSASFILVSCKKEGCTDPTATNYNSSANHDNGSCLFDATGGGSGGGGGTTTIVTDNVTTPTVWSGNVSVCGAIGVTSSLVIQEGTTITMCAASRIDVSASGSMTAIGTLTNPISFVGETAAQGFWQGIRFSSNNPNNQFDYVTVRDGGSYWAFQYANVNVSTQAQLSLTNSTISNSDQLGLYASETATLNNFSNNTFSNNGTYGVEISANQISSMDEASNYNVNNVEPFINVRDAVVNGNHTWKKTSTPYLFNGSTQIDGALTIEPGAQLQFESAAALTINLSGSVTAIGTLSDPIVFEGRFASSGYWRSLNIRSNNPNNQLAYVSFEDGGQYWAQDYSSLYITTGARVEMNNCSISNANSWGMYVGSSSTVIAGGSTQTDAAGVLSFNTMTGNGAGPDANCSGGGCTVYFD
jgi:hypothetical protein